MIDALTAGLTQASRRPLLVLIPALVDFVLWLTPMLSIATLTRRFLVVWEALARTAYTPEQWTAVSTMIATARDAMTQIGSQINLTETLTGSWLAAPSALAASQATRLTFISDMVLSPAGLSLDLRAIAPAPWRAAPVDVPHLWVAVSIVVLLWLAKQVWVTFYLWRAAADRAPAGKNAVISLLRNRGQAPASDPAPGQAASAAPSSVPVGVRGFLLLMLRLAVFSVLLGIIVFVLRLPLALAATMMLFSGSTASGIMFVLIGGMTLWILLWFLTSFFFVSEAILLDRQPLRSAILQSIVLVRSNGLATIGLVLVVNLLMLGFRVIWGLIGRSPAGAMVAILGNAYLATAMLLAVFTYFDDLKRRLTVSRAGKKVDR